MRKLIVVQSRKKNEKGLSAVEVIIVIVVVALLVFGGILVYQRSKKVDSAKSNANNVSSSNTYPPSEPSASTKPNDPYASWKTAKLASEELSFRYPADWTLKGSADNILVSSPVTDNHYFEIDLIASADTRDVDLNALGKSRALPVLDLKTKYNGLPLYLVAGTPTPDEESIVGLGLAVAPAGASTTLGVDKSKSVSGKFITMSAHLVPVTSSLGDNGFMYPFQKYKDSTNYAIVLQVFQSISSR